MKIQNLSTRLLVRRLGKADLDAMLALCAGNPLFYQYHPPLATHADLLADLSALPPGKTPADKFFVGFFAPEEGAAPAGHILGKTAARPGQLVAMMDLILGYPRPGTAFIGLFMVGGALQGCGLGSGIISECIAALAACGFDTVRLGVDEGNPQSAAFWAKNGFVPTGERTPWEHGAYLPMERQLTAD